MTKTLLALALFFFLPAFAADVPVEAKSDFKTVAAGTTDVIDCDYEPGPAPIIGNKTILEASVSGKQVKVTALKKGSSSLIIFDAKGAIRHKLIYNVISK